MASWLRNLKLFPLWVLAVAAALSGQQSAVLAQQSIKGPITIVVAFAPGASTDGLARLLADGMSKKLNTTVIIDNKPGAFGTIAANFVKTAAPDGRTLLLASSTTFAIGPNLYKAADFDPVRDFTTIASLATGQNILAIHPSIEATTIQEFIALAKANPGKFSYGSNSGTSLVASELFKTMAGVDITEIPYKSVGNQITDVLTGRISMVILDQLNAAPLVQGGQLRGLAVAGGQRSKLVPDLPTLDESGLKGFQINSWIGLAGPAGVPKPMADKLNSVTNEIVAGPDYARKLEAFGYEPILHTPAQASDLVRDDLKRWASMIALTKMEKQ